VLTGIKVDDTPFDYNIFRKRSYMYTMKVVASFIFYTIMFHNDDKIIILDQLTY